ncbi:HPP family protein [Setomelanomma holmii]|uniref:HPP family protein n=1 Tax=Setomelanomma holmii TaxID=210430 RepID=A0A9P4LKP8_9PLEO|nr:HPP family protein [Setomelanomma holmii]
MGIFDRARDWDLDLDRYLNPILPPSQLHRLPTSVSKFLGYRKVQRQDVGNILGAFWSLVGAFCGLAVIAAVFNNTGSIQRHQPPALIASFGASAILEYNAIRSPLGQPRNALLGHTFSALIGVGISKLFQYHPDYESIKWIAGAVACGTASAVMLLTGTVHPPGGASAVLAATEPVITAMGWYFVGLVVWGTTLMVLVGLVINNVQRQFPVYWWTPVDLARRKKDDEEIVANGQRDVVKRIEDEIDQDDGTIRITGSEVLLPADLSLNAEETTMLQSLKERLRKSIDRKEEKETERSDSTSGRSSTEFTMVPSRSDVGDATSS